MSFPSVARVPAPVGPDSGIGELLQAAEMAVSELIRGCPPGDPMHPRLEQVQHTVQRLATLTGQLGVPAHRDGARATALDLNTVVREMAPALQRLLGPFISLETTLHQAGAWAACDRGQIEQVALGLVINAREALPLGGTVGWGTQRWLLDAPRQYRAGSLPAGDWAVLEVRDNGAGVDDRTAHPLLEPSARGLAFDSSLSLATVSAIVRAAGGHVVLDTGGSGTLLAACFPAVAPPRSRQPATGVASAILVVDDDEWVRLSTARTLRRAGYGVLEAQHPADAIELLDDVAGSCIRLLIVDARLLAGGVLPLGEHIRRERPEVELVVTGSDVTALGNYDRPSALEKPYNSADLLRVVRSRLPAPH